LGGCSEKVHLVSPRKVAFDHGAQKGKMCQKEKENKLRGKGDGGRTDQEEKG